MDNGILRVKDKTVLSIAREEDWVPYLPLSPKYSEKMTQIWTSYIEMRANSFDERLAHLKRAKKNQLLLNRERPQEDQIMIAESDEQSSGEDKKPDYPTQTLSPELKEEYEKIQEPELAKEFINNIMTGNK